MGPQHGARIGKRPVAGGHTVTVLGRQPADAEAVVAGVGGSAQAGQSGDALADDVVVLAVYFPDAKVAVEQYADDLAGRVLVDITNPVNATFDGLVTPPDSSAAQELAATAEGVRVVKAFDTTFASTLEEGTVAGQPLDVFVASDDNEAKATVVQLAEDGGLRPSDAGRSRWPGSWRRRGCCTWVCRADLALAFSSALKILS